MYWPPTDRKRVKYGQLKNKQYKQYKQYKMLQLYLCILPMNNKNKY